VKRPLQALARLWSEGNPACRLPTPLQLPPKTTVDFLRASIYQTPCCRPAVLPFLECFHHWIRAVEMGNVSSSPEEGATLYLRDQNRLSISSVVISSPRKRTSINIVPNAFPATRVSASRSLGDNSPVEFVQDPETTSGAGGPSFLLKLTDDGELVFTFTFVIRKTPPADGSKTTPPSDTQINGLTFVYASNVREVENLVTREFHADPNLHKNANVALVGGAYSTEGSPSVTFEWTWKWKPPRNTEDKGGGWRNSCSVRSSRSILPVRTPAEPWVVCGVRSTSPPAGYPSQFLLFCYQRLAISQPPKLSNTSYTSQRPTEGPGGIVTVG
jgi:hypothetical protein